MTTQKKKRGPKGEKVEGIEWLHLLGRAALSVLLGLALALVVPTRFTEEMGAQTMARYAAPFSGYLFDVERGKAAAKDPVQWNEREITVLAIDREALRARGEGWPARYPFYSWLLGYLNEYRPTGLFIDVILSQPRNKDCDGSKATGFSGFKKANVCYCTNDIDDFGDFRQALTDLASNKVPVFLAARREPDNTLGTNAALDSDSALKSLRRVGVEFSAHSVDRLAWTYPLVYAGKEPGDTQTTHPVAAGAAVPDHPDPSKSQCTASAAFAIFSDVYDKDKKLNVPCNEPKSMSITWPLDTATDGLLWQESADEESEARHHMPRILRADLGDDDEEMYCTSNGNLSTLLKRAEARALFRPSSRPLCVHYRTIHASQLERMSPEDLDKAFSNHFVMIGTSFAYSNDLVLSPLQDRIPGVFLHAVALDNLLSRGDKLENVEAWELDFRTSADRWGRLFALGAVGFGLIFFTVFLKKEARKKFARFHRERTHWRKPLHWHWWAAKGMTAAFNITLFVTSFIVLVAFGVLMILLGNWMLVPFLLISHVLACTIAVEWLEWSEHLFNWITDSKED